MTILPDKPSALIRAALEDLAKIRRNPLYIVNMGTWHSPRYVAKDGVITFNPEAGALPVCVVCWAGSVMAKSLDAELDEDCTPEDYPADVSAKLEALHEFRRGDVPSGLAYLGMGWGTDTWSSKWKLAAKYEDDYDAWRSEMLRLATELEERKM